MHLGEVEPTLKELSFKVSLEARRNLLKEDEDLNLVLQDEWVQLVRGKGENIPSGGEERSKGGEGGGGGPYGLFSEPRRPLSRVCIEGRGREGARSRTGKVSDQGAGSRLVRAWL